MGGNTYNKTTINTRFAPYLESYHQRFLLNMETFVGALATASPFHGYTEVPVDEAFFGTGYLMMSFPALFDVFGKEMSGFDFETEWLAAMKDLLTTDQIRAYVEKQSQDIDDKISYERRPDFQVLMRNMNAVNTSSFVIGNAILEDQRVKDVEQVSYLLLSGMIKEGEKKFGEDVNSHQDMARKYAFLMQFYYDSKDIIDTHNYRMLAKDKLWPFEVLDWERQGLQAMNRLPPQEKIEDTLFLHSRYGRMWTVASNTASGAMTGWSVGGPWGAVGGAVAGVFIGLAQAYSENPPWYSYAYGFAVADPIGAFDLSKPNYRLMWQDLGPCLPAFTLSEVVSFISPEAATYGLIRLWK